MKYLFYFSLCKCFPNKISFSLLSFLLPLKELEFVTTSILLVWSLLGLGCRFGSRMAAWFSSFDCTHSTSVTWLSQTSSWLYLWMAVLEDGLSDARFHPHRTLFMLVNSVKTFIIEGDACRVSLWWFSPSGKHSKYLFLMFFCFVFFFWSFACFS